MAESHISLSLLLDQQPSILLDQNESTCIFAGFQKKVTFHTFKDPYIDLLQPSGKMNFLVFMDHEYIFSANSELPHFCLVYLDMNLKLLEICLQGIQFRIKHV